MVVICIYIKNMQQCPTIYLNQSLFIKAAVMLTAGSRLSVLGTAWKHSAYRSRPIGNLGTLTSRSANQKLNWTSIHHVIWLVYMLKHGAKYFNLQVAGRFVEYHGMTMVTVRGAGHLVPLNKPAEGLMLINAFLHGEKLPTSRWYALLMKLWRYKMAWTSIFIERRQSDRFDMVVSKSISSAP